MIKYKLDYQNTIKITDEREVVYTISKKHRGHNKEKSYWLIKMPREIALFRSALKVTKIKPITPPGTSIL